MLHKVKNLYDTLPKNHLTFLRHIPDRVLFGRTYSIQKSAVSYNKTVVGAQLHALLTYARKHTAYGRDVIPQGFSPLESMAVLRELPSITSADLSRNLSYYVSDAYSSWNSYLTTTGGTGRNPTSIRLSNESYAAEWAHMHTIWAHIGYDRRSHLKLTLRGKQLKPDMLVTYNPLYNELVADTFKFSYENFPRFWKETFSRPVAYIHGYPSLVKEFMEYCRYFHKHPHLKGIMLASEGASVEDKEALRGFFQCPVVSWYGQSEKVALAYDLAGTNEFKLFTSYGYAYVRDPDTEGLGEILGTTFINKALPLFNYRTGDYGRQKEKDDGLYLCDIRGRWGKDFVWRDPSKRIPTSAINLHSDIQHEILFYQLHQSTYGQLHIRILCKKTSRLTPVEIQDKVRREIADKLKDFSVTAEVVHDEGQIVKSVRGKMIMLLQELPNEKEQK